MQTLYKIFREASGKVHEKEVIRLVSRIEENQVFQSLNFEEACDTMAWWNEYGQGSFILVTYFVDQISY